MDGDRNNSPLTFEDLNHLEDEEVESRIAAACNPLRFDVRLPSVGFTNEPTDIAEDYVDAAFFAEKAGKHCESIEACPVDLKHGLLIRFTMTPQDVSALIGEIRRIQPWFDSDNHDPSEELRNEVCEFFDGFLEADLRVPELGDSYMANFLAGSRYDENQEEFNRKCPTWQWGHWRSFAADRLGCEFYTSSVLDGTWIVLGNRATVERLLRDYGGFSTDGSHLHCAKPLQVGRNPHLLIGPQVVTQVPSGQLDKAVSCWSSCIAPELTHSYNVSDMATTDSDGSGWPELRDREAFGRRYQERFIRFEQRRRSRCKYRYGLSWAMTESGDAIVCGDESINFVAFTHTSDRLRPEAIQDLLPDTERVLEMLRDQAGLGPAAQLDWSLLSPEQFEDLCYDVILRSGRFDDKTIRKHGKTRSRDGGRDIEVWTLPRVEQPAHKWILQCKLVTNGRALAGSKVAVADVIDQYGADGFGVMTNEVIDSTLYDKLDAIASRRGIQLDTWDGRRLQRFLRIRPDLMQCYFPTEEPTDSPSQAK